MNRTALLKPTLLTLAALACLAVATPSAFAQDEGHIYGVVTTVDGNKYEGALRWEDEEAFWTDLFNAEKTRNENERLVDRRKMEEHFGSDARDRESSSSIWGGSAVTIWNDRSDFGTHQFVCRFGDLKSIEIYSNSRVRLTLKSGDALEVQDNSNDIGADILVYDRELGEAKIDWDRIDRIDFKQGPSQLKEKPGKALYGTVYTFTKGEMTGYIMWDKDECVTEDRLDGYVENGKFSIDFGNVASIRATRRGSNVILKSGREMYMRGTNDVNDENRGIMVKSDEWGTATVSWKDFDRIEFKEPPGSGPAYTDFSAPRLLTGKVRTLDGREFDGRLIFDVDENWNLEMLDGNDDDVEYSIPFRKVKAIRPKNHEYSTVELRSGKRLLLGKGQDVSDRNDGVLVFVDGPRESPLLVPWSQIEVVEFD